jgi:hypothetical protein
MHGALLALSELAAAFGQRSECADLVTKVTYISTPQIDLTNGVLTDILIFGTGTRGYDTFFAQPTPDRGCMSANRRKHHGGTNFPRATCIGATLEENC